MIKVRIPRRFTIPVMLVRREAGSYVNGIYVDGFETTPIEIYVSWQALTPSEYRLLPQGSSPLSVFNVFWNGTFIMGGDGGLRPDELVKGSTRYKALKPNNWEDAGYTTSFFQEIKT